MGRLLVITQPALAPGFQLAGVETFAVNDSASAQRLIAGWLDQGEVGLLAIDEDLFDGFNASFRRRLEANDRLPAVALPNGLPVSDEASRRSHIADLIRRAIGFHITFRGDKL